MNHLIKFSMTLILSACCLASATPVTRVIQVEPKVVPESGDINTVRNVTLKVTGSRTLDTDVTVGTDKALVIVSGGAPITVPAGQTGTIQLTVKPLSSANSVQYIVVTGKTTKSGSTLGVPINITQA